MSRVKTGILLAEFNLFRNNSILLKTKSSIPVGSKTKSRNSKDKFNKKQRTQICLPAIYRAATKKSPS